MLPKFVWESTTSLNTKYANLSFQLDNVFGGGFVKLCSETTPSVVAATLTWLQVVMGDARNLRTALGVKSGLAKYR
ncbi:MAG: hypothetical protein IPH28_23585 [Cytophagaceae bacterium]|nr:hypothetical protein [Cytophagaceae bacterium]